MFEPNHCEHCGLEATLPEPARDLQVNAGAICEDMQRQKDTKLLESTALACHGPQHRKTCGL